MRFLLACTLALGDLCLEDVLRKARLRARPICVGAGGHSRVFVLSAPGREQAVMAVTLPPWSKTDPTVVRLRLFWRGPIDYGTLDDERLPSSPGF